MPDITMCTGGDCKSKNDCYRYLAEANPHRQSFFVLPPFNEKRGGHSCEYYWTNRGND